MNNHYTTKHTLNQLTYLENLTANKLIDETTIVLIIRKKDNDHVSIKNSPTKKTPPSTIEIEKHTTTKQKIQ